MKCSLQKPEDVTTWSEDATAKFNDISADGQTIFTIKKLSTDETSVVQLFLNEVDIVTKLLETGGTVVSSTDDEAVPTSTEGDTAPSTEGDTAPSTEDDTCPSTDGELAPPTENGSAPPTASTPPTNENVSQSTEESGNMAQSTEEGYVTDVESLENLQIEVAGKPKTDSYKLETVGDKPWDKSATEKFKDVNQEGI